MTVASMESAPGILAHLGVTKVWYRDQGRSASDGELPRKHQGSQRDTRSTDANKNVLNASATHERMVC